MAPAIPLDGGRQTILGIHSVSLTLHSTLTPHRGIFGSDKQSSPGFLPLWLWKELPWTLTTCSRSLERCGKRDRFLRVAHCQTGSFFRNNCDMDRMDVPWKKLCDSGGNTSFRKRRLFRKRRGFSEKKGFMSWQYVILKLFDSSLWITTISPQNWLVLIRERDCDQIRVVDEDKDFSGSK
jgi:hypothetical protein